MSAVHCFRFQLILCVLFASLLNACSLFPVNKKVLQNPQWQSHKHSINKIQYWNVQGRFAAKNQKDSWNGQFHWINDHRNYDIIISAPLNGGSFQLKGNHLKAELILQDNHHYSDDDANGLIHKYTGISLPINELQYWMLGLPAPDGSLYNVDFDKQGRLKRFKQSGWTVNFKRYKSQQKVSLPEKIFLENYAYDVRIIVQKWVVD